MPILFEAIQPRKTHNTLVAPTVKNAARSLLGFVAVDDTRPWPKAIDVMVEFEWNPDKVMSDEAAQLHLTIL